MNDRLWTTSAPTSPLPSLREALQAETVIVGGGITGLLTAYLLAKAGKKPILLEKNGLGTGETGSTTALVTMIVDVRLSTLTKRFGERAAAAVWESGRQAIDLIEEIIRNENISCSFMRCPARVYAASAEDSAALKLDAALAERLGFTVAWHARGARPFERFGVLEAPGQAKFDPGAFIAGLAEAVIRKGGRIFVQSPVTGFTGAHDTTVVTESGRVSAKHVVVATHAPIDNRFETPSRIVGYQSYAIAADLPAGTIPEGISWDTADPYHYFRVDRMPSHDRIILGGEDHKTGEQPESADPFSSLAAYLATLTGAETAVTHRWSGQVLATIDGLPYIGPSVFNSRHIIATGYAGNGITYGAVAAGIAADAVLERKNPWAKLYSPKRLSGLARFLAIGGATVRSLIGDHLLAFGRPLRAPDRGDGKVLTVRGKKTAVFRTSEGKIVAVSAVCTHLGCLVRWNGTEKTWDCPCHGSRFLTTGAVVCGPANKPLKRLPRVERGFAGPADR